jgi:hypothetical protein
MEAGGSEQTAGGHVPASRSAEEQAFSFRVSLVTPPDSFFVSSIRPRG